VSGIRDDEGSNRSTAGPEPGTARAAAGPVTGEGGALRAEGPSSTPPSPAPPAGESPETASGPSDSAADAASDGERVDQDFDALLADTQRERDEYLDLAKRTKADFENFRKRMTTEVQAAALRGKADLIREVVTVLDNLERALESEGIDPEGDSPDGLAHGVLLVFRNLRETLTRHGVEAVDPEGDKFDPVSHEALSTQAVEGTEPGIVVEVMQKGYRLGEQLIRPARVVVSE
jgi:molecular chaperone GrpE